MSGLKINLTIRKASNFNSSFPALAPFMFNPWKLKKLEKVVKHIDLDPVNIGFVDISDQ